MAKRRDNAQHAVLLETNLETLIGEYVPLTEEEREVTAVDRVHVGGCPFHDDFGSSLEVTFMRFECEVCGAKGDAIDFVSMYEQVGEDRATAMLAERARLTPAMLRAYRDMEVAGFPARPRNKVEVTICQETRRVGVLQTIQVCLFIIRESLLSRSKLSMALFSLDRGRIITARSNDNYRSEPDEFLIVTLKDELRFYADHVKEWREHEGKFVLIRGKEAVGFFVERADALKETVRLYGMNEPVLIKKVVIVDEADSMDMVAG